MSDRIPHWSDVHDRGASPRARALQAWLVEPHKRLGAHWEEEFVAGMIELLASATLDDCVYAGFEFDPARKPLRGTTVWDKGYWASIEFSADDASTARHRAVGFIRMDEYGTRVWVDGEALPVPCDEGVPLAEPHVSGWCEDRYFFIEIGGLDYDPHQHLGHVRGLLIHDADARVTRIEYPDDGQLWTSPRPVVEGGELRVYATRDEVSSGPPARVIPLERAFAPDGGR